MASREKRLLAPSKSKQKANNDSGLPSNEVKSKKGKSLPNIKHQQLARDIFEAVATDSQLPPKIEASLPRKKVFKNLKRKQKLRVAKTNFIKAKVTKKVKNKTLCRINSDVKKGPKAKRIKLAEEVEEETVDSLNNYITDSENDKISEAATKSAKNNLRTKKGKAISKTCEELDIEDIADKNLDIAIGSTFKSSSKLNKKSKVGETADSSPKSAKPSKVTAVKRNTLKEKENNTKNTESSDVKYPKSKKSNREVDCISSIKNTSNIHTKSSLSKSVLDNKSSIDLTIDEVIASMLSDPEIDNQQSTAEKIEGKITRSRKMLVDENMLSDGESKKESTNEEVRIMSEGEYPDIDQGNHFAQSTIQLRKRSNNLTGPRSLRNGKLRQLSDSGVSTDVDLRKRRRLNSDEPAASEISIEHISDSNVDTESCFSESSGNDSQAIPVLCREESSSVKYEMTKNYTEGIESSVEVENNNNSERIDRVGEIGPTLRSKTKARSTESEIKSDDVKNEENARITPKNVETQDEIKRAVNLDHVRKDTILSKLADRSKGRRTSLNIDMRKTVNSFYGTEKSDGNGKSQIDQMIENIKLTIAKSIESKIFGPEKGLGLSKNFEVPKIEEIVAPLSTESQKLGLEDSADEDKPNASKNEIKSESSENSVPKVADTAKEIEKLVMGDIELVETQSQNTQDNDAPNIESVNITHNIHESTHAAVDDDANSCKDEEKDKGSQSCSTTVSEKSEDRIENQIKLADDGKKVLNTRKSMRIIDKNSSESFVEPDNGKKINKVTDKVGEKHNGADKSSSDEASKSCQLVEDQSHSGTCENELKSHNATKLLPFVNIKEQVQLADTEKRTSDTDESRNESDEMEVAAISKNVEDSETLENISSDVEKLIAEDSSVIQLDTFQESGKYDKDPDSTTAENKPAVTNVSHNEREDSSMDGFIMVSESSIVESKETEVVTDTDEVPGKSNISNKCVNDNEHSEVSVNVSECVQYEKEEESDVSGVVSCDLNVKYNSMKSTTHNSTCTSVIETNNTECDIIKTDDQGIRNGDNNDTQASMLCDNSNEEITSHKKIDTSADEKNVKLSIEKDADEQKSIVEESKRVLRVRDKQKKMEKRPTSCDSDYMEDAAKCNVADDLQEVQDLNVQIDIIDKQSFMPDDKAIIEIIQNKEEVDNSQISVDVESNDSLELQGRTRRSREIKKNKEDQHNLNNTLKTKRTKRDLRKSDQQKEETLLDNEVAKINENNRTFLNDYNDDAKCTKSFRGFSEGSHNKLCKIQNNTGNIRSKSENDIIITNESIKPDEEAKLSRNFSENHTPKDLDNINLLDTECKDIKTPEISQKDSDEASTSSESSSSVNIASKILETPEDKAKKESILRLLGLESLEKAAERLSHQKARKEQYTGTLKTVIRVQKDKEKDKKRSRSPLKMVLKQGRGDGEGDSPEFYTIQKEFGTSGLGDSSSGANRKFTTNHRYSCDEDNEETPPKDRQSLIIPEKSSSFSIHPGRLCADVCCYCFGKFGSLDTPMHLAQMKSDERRKKILNVERHLTKDSCLCDACYRHVDRKANTSPTNMQTKPQKQHRQLMVSKCSARECRDPARHHVKRRWLLKIKAGLQNQVDIDWESSQHTSMSFCVIHYAKIERFLTCALCKRRLARNHTHQLANAETDELNQLLTQQGIPVLLAAGTFVCKLCRYFTQLQLKYKDVENMNTNHRSFFKSYRKRILHYHDIEVLENEDDDSSQNQTKDKEKRKKSQPKTQPKGGNSKSPDGTMNSASEKSTPEPNKNDNINSERDNENRSAKININDDSISTDVQYLNIESTVENLKKRKLLDMDHYPSDTTVCYDGGASETVEILAMDKEVTLTRLPKRPRTSNDITPVVQRLGANPSISVRTLFPGEEEMNLHANVEFTNVREITPQGWEKCATMIQYDRDTKMLWQELQRPYGNQSSFLRHLILLEKYYRSGDLILAPNASRNAINYSTSVQNRLISYEGPEKMDEPIMEPISTEFNNPRRLSGGYVLERDRLSLPSTSSLKSSTSAIQSAKGSPPRVLKLNSGVSIIKKPPPNLQRLNLPSTSSANGNLKRKDGQKLPISSGKVIQLSEPDFKRLQNLKRQKQIFSEKSCVSPNSGARTSNSSPTFKSTTQYQKAQIAAHSQFQKHLRMQQEMLNRQSRGDFEPLICDVRSLANENSPTQNLIHNLNLPKSIQVTTKPPNPIPILPKIPKSLTVIPQTITRPTDK